MPKLDKLARELKAVAHPGRLAVLQFYWHKGGLPTSPHEASQELSESLGMVSYHVRKLHQAKLLKKVEDKPRRGAIEHYYQLTNRGLAVVYAIFSVLAEK